MIHQNNAAHSSSPANAGKLFAKHSLNNVVGCIAIDTAFFRNIGRFVGRLVSAVTVMPLIAGPLKLAECASLVGEGTADKVYKSIKSYVVKAVSYPLAGIGAVAGTALGVASAVLLSPFNLAFSIMDSGDSCETKLDLLQKERELAYELLKGKINLKEYNYVLNGPGKFID